AYRIAMIALAGFALYAVFAVLAHFLEEQWAFFGAATFALCPFVVHEIFFTWPKLVATAWLLCAFLFAHERKPFLCGLALATGYFYHPMILLWVPWLAIWMTIRDRIEWRIVVARVAWLGGGLC